MLRKLYTKIVYMHTETVLLGKITLITLRFGSNFALLLFDET